MQSQFAPRYDRTENLGWGSRGHFCSSNQPALALALKNSHNLPNVTTASIDEYRCHIARLSIFERYFNQKGSKPEVTGASVADRVKQLDTPDALSQSVDWYRSIGHLFVEAHI